MINGVCRDSNRAMEVGYPIFQPRHLHAHRQGPRHGRRLQHEDLAGRGRGRAPGDIICGDADGLVIVPRPRADAVLEAAQEIADAEESIREALGADTRLDDARRRAGYHKLQERAAPDASSAAAGTS